MKAALGKGWKWLLGLLMGLLGFTGCGKLGIFRAEYGCPNADFKLVGDVKDANGNGIEGIQTRQGMLPSSLKMWTAVLMALSRQRSSPVQN